MSNVNEKPTFASRFRELCGISDQNVLAESLNVTKNTFRQWMSGNATPTVNKLIRLSEYFNVSTDYLLGLSDIKTKDVDVENARKIFGLSESAMATLKSKNAIIREAANALFETESGILFLTSLNDAIEIARNGKKDEDTDIVAIDTIIKTKSKYTRFINNALCLGNYYDECQNYCYIYMTRALQSLIKSVEAEAESSVNDNKKRKRK